MQQRQQQQALPKQEGHEEQNTTKIPELKFDPKTLYGRETEVEQVLSCWRRCCQDHHQELLVLRGMPGTGKSTLAKSLKHYLDREKPRPSGIFVEGKFTESAVDEPYGAFVTAFSQYVDQLFLSLDTKTLEKCSLDAKEAVGEDGGPLTSVVPALERILGKQSNDSGDERDRFGMASLCRFHIAFANLVAALTNSMPMGLFIDDVQWADSASLELLRNLMRGGPFALTIICGYRFCKGRNEEGDSQQILKSSVQSEQVPDNLDRLGQDLVLFQSTLNDLMAESSVRVTVADLGVLQKKDVCLLLSTIFQNDGLETSNLADIVLAHTEGNVFHVIQLIRFLVGRGLVEWDDHGNRWKWDNCQLRKSLESVDSILDLLREPLESVSRVTQEVLKTASCLGDDIDDSALGLILQTRVFPHLLEAEKIGLLTFRPCSGGYHFTHDWIRAAAFEMIPEEERDEFYLRIGRRLWQASSLAARAENVVQITKLMNKGSGALSEQRERMKLSELNLKAGKRARFLNSFPDAARFLNKGISLLSVNSWRDCYALTLDLYNTAAEVEATNGNFENVVSYIQEVITKAVDLDDKLRAYETLLRVMPQQGNLEETIVTAVKVLKQLGERLPPVATKFAALKELARVQLALRGKSDQDILDLPLMTDKNKTACIRILNLIFLTCYEGRSPYTAIAAFRLMQFTLKYGRNGASGLGFAFYAAILCGYSLDVHLASRYGRLGLSLAERDSSPESLPVTHFILGALVHHWSRPLREFTFGELALADKKALEVGSIEIALASRASAAIYSLYSGSNLNSVKSVLKDIVRVARVYRHRKSELLAALPLQMIHCLQGSAPHPGRLTGTVFSIEECLKEFKEKGNKLHLEAVWWYSAEVAFFAGDIDYAMKSLQQIPDSKQPAASLMQSILHYHKALICIADARKYGRNRQASVKTARQILKRARKWAADSPANFRHMQLVLEAELMTLSRYYSEDKVIELYKKAVAAAGAEDYIPMQALAYESFADFSTRSGNATQAHKYYNKAATLYDKWGAKVKSQALIQLRDGKE